MEQIGALPGKSAAGVRDAKVVAARDGLCRSTIHCLDRYGYAETSIGRIIETAGVSRGALTHHYKTKEDLIVDSINRLLLSRLDLALPSRKTKSIERSPAEQGSAAPTTTSNLLRRDLLWIWKSLNTAEGCALVEVLLASRTDATLARRITPKLLAWNDRAGDYILTFYKSIHGNDQVIVTLWEMSRVYFRGLTLQKSFGRDKAGIEALAEAYVEMAVATYSTQLECMQLPIAPQLQHREAVV